MLSAAKHLYASRDRPFAEFPLSEANGLRVTRDDGSNWQGLAARIVDFRKDVEAVRSEAGRIINSIKTFSESLTKDVEMYGVRRGYIESIIQARKQRLLNNKNVLTSLGVPIRKSVNPIKPTITTNNGSEKGKRTVSSTPQPNKAIEVFISYSHNQGLTVFWLSSAQQECNTKDEE